MVLHVPCSINALPGQNVFLDHNTFLVVCVVSGKQLVAVCVLGIIHEGFWHLIVAIPHP